MHLLIAGLLVGSSPIREPKTPGRRILGKWKFRRLGSAKHAWGGFEEAGGLDYLVGADKSPSDE